MKNLKIKIITGFRENQYYVIDGDEAHKAYYLFMHPEERGVFQNGVAIIGKNIQGIEPAWNETMGWNPSHKIDSDDWNEINSKGIKYQANELLSEARRIIPMVEQNTTLLQLNLSELIKKLPAPEFNNDIKRLMVKFKL